MKKLDRISNSTKRSAMRKILLSLSLSLIMVFSVIDAEAQFACPPGWQTGDPITHLIYIDQVPHIITIHWCYRPSQNGSPYSDIYIGGWSVSPSPGAGFSLSEEDIVKLIVIYKKHMLGFNYPFHIPVCPNKTQELFHVFNGGCYTHYEPNVVDPPLLLIPCDIGEQPRKCKEGYTFCFQWSPSGSTELIVEATDRTIDFECDFSQGELTPCMPMCDY